MMERDRIAVGVDGSDGSAAALRWALEEAAGRGADVEIVTCWHLPYMVEASGYARGYLTEEEREAGPNEVLRNMLAAADPEVRAAADAGRQVTTCLVEDEPGRGLVDHCGDATMLVVGRRGDHALARLLGSVSRHVAEHANCPVVVVPPS
jgi:nucleotide-binding universal stress UspA family protein